MALSWLSHQNLVSKNFVCSLKHAVKDVGGGDFIPRIVLSAFLISLFFKSPLNQEKMLSDYNMESTTDKTGFDSRQRHRYFSFLQRPSHSPI